MRLKGPLKELGLYTVLIHLGQDVEGELKVWVVPTMADEPAGQTGKEGLKWPRSSASIRTKRRPRSRPKSSTGNPRAAWKPSGRCWAACCCKPDVSDDVALVLRTDDFYDEAHRRLYAHMRAIHDEGRTLDPTLLVERIKTAGDLEFIGGMAYLAEIMQSVATAAHAVYYAEIVRNKSTLRSLIHSSTEILREAYDAIARLAGDARPGPNRRSSRSSTRGPAASWTTSAASCRTRWCGSTPA